MKIVLLQDIRGVGRKHDIKDVSDGYARNFLIGKGLARAADQAAIQDSAAKKQSAEMELASLKEKLRIITKEFSDQPLIVKVKTGPHKELFKSITVDEIKNALAFRGVNGIEVELPKAHLKTIGTHQIEIDLGRGVKGKLNINIQA